MKIIETEAHRLDRLANRQRMADIERHRRRVRRREWLKSNIGELITYLLVCAAAGVTIWVLM